MLNKIHTKDFRNKLIKKYIRYKKVNGLNIIDIEFIKGEFKKPSAIILSELDLKSEDSFKDEEFKKIIKEMVAKLINDEKLNFKTNQKTKVEKYEEMFVHHDFQKIFEKEYEVKENVRFENKKEALIYGEENKLKINLDTEKKEKGMFVFESIRKEKECFYVNEDNLLIHFDTYYGKFNSIHLYVECEPNEGVDDLVMSLQASGGYVRGTKIVNMEIDARTGVESKIWKIYEKSKVRKKWLDSGQRYYSYLSHKNVEVSENEKWESLLFDKLKNFPENVLINMFSKNRRKEKVIEKLQNEGFNIETDIDKIEDAVNFFTTEEKNELAIRDNFLDYGYTDVVSGWENFLYKSKELGFSEERFPEVFYVILSKITKEIYLRDLEVSEFLRVLSKFNKEECEIFEKNNYLSIDDKTIEQIKHELKLLNKIKDF